MSKFKRKADSQPAAPDAVAKPPADWRPAYYAWREDLRRRNVQALLARKGIDPERERAARYESIRRQFAERGRPAQEAEDFIGRLEGLRSDRARRQAAEAKVRAKPPGEGSLGKLVEGLKA